MTENVFQSMFRATASGLTGLSALAASAALGQEPPMPVAAQTAPALTEPTTQPAPPPAPGEIIMREALLIDRVGQYGRAAVHTDAIEAQIVAGTWTVPKAGDSSTLADTTVHAWSPVSVAADGRFRHSALEGGYALWTVQSDHERVMLLQAQGHNCVYVNGELRAGDPYALDVVALPIVLRAGDNALLFQCSRGQLSAKLVAPREPVMFWPADTTLPDVIAGQLVDLWGAIVVINSTSAPMREFAIAAAVPGQPATLVDVPSILPMSARKIPFHLAAAAVSPPPDSPSALSVRLELVPKAPDAARTIDAAEFSLAVCAAHQLHKRTFISTIDGSVQYYAVRPAQTKADASAPPALVLTLHGASVEASAQAAAYQSKDWCHIIAPTNRRPYGFDWEDWGRLDALEVLEIAQREFPCDSQRTYLTGHSMGGHGTWHLAATFPDRFAAIGPSAGWISFWSYAGAAKYENSNHVQDILMRAVSASDTLALSRNYLQQGIYVLHGAADENVPVAQARTMRQHLAEYHTDFAYHERSGAGHWWGNECVDWPRMFEFFRHHRAPSSDVQNAIEFQTACPGVSAQCHWTTIEAQIQQCKTSSINLTRDLRARRFAGTTTNVARLGLRLIGFQPGEPVHVEFDGQKLENIPWPAEGDQIWLARSGEAWSVSSREPLDHKGPHRCGLFKDAFRNRMMLVYGTQGTPEENAWALHKARFDAETFWYRGNGSIDVVADFEFDPAAEPDRSIILYGNSQTNAAWASLLGESPVQIRGGSTLVGDQEINGDNHACLMIRPRPGSQIASVGAIGAPGPIGMRLTDRMPYFMSGVAYPDCIVIGVESLSSGTEGVRVAGFFGQDWSIATGEFAWRP